jgi:hypothetical protein
VAADIVVFAGTADTTLDSTLQLATPVKIKSFVPPAMPGRHVHLDASKLP